MKVYGTGSALIKWFAMIVLCISVGGCGYSQPEDAFLKSKWHIAALHTPGMGTVAHFVDALKKAQMSNGKRFEVLGWKKNDNVYILHVQALKKLEVRFTHVLSPPSNGAESVLDVVMAGDDSINPALFAMDVLAAAEASGSK